MRREYHDILREQVLSQTLPCGFEIHLLPKKGFRQKSAFLAVEFGSLDERAETGPPAIPQGTAHFLEHRLFEKPGGDLAERFSALGAEVNAQTSFTSTAYTFSCIDHFAPCLDLLFDLVLEAHFPAEGVEREREIIAREIQLYSDNLEWVSYLNALRALYPDTPIALDIAGTAESIEAIDTGVLERCHSAFYRPANMRLFVAGDIEAEHLADAVGERLRSWGAEARLTSRRPLLKPSCSAQVAHLPVVRPHLLVAFGDRRSGLEGRALLAREMALELALDTLFGAASDFFSRHYESGQIDAESFASEVYAERPFCFCLVGGDARHPERLQEAIVRELERACRGDLIERDFERARRRIYGQLLAGFDQVESCAELMHGAISSGAHPFDYFSAYQELGPEQVRECLESCLDYRAHGTSLVLPLALEEAA